MSFDFDDFDVRSRFIDLDEKSDEMNALLDTMPEERESFEEKCKIAYIHHDCALDGVVLTYHELRAAVDRKVMSDSALLLTYQEIKNHCDALELIQEHCRDEMLNMNRARNPKVTVQLIHDMHVLLAKDLPRKTPGVLRKDMPLHRTYFHQIHEPDMIEEGLKKVEEMVSQADFRAQHPINQASLFHHAFMSVFPFSDGAGKVGRLLMNYFLMRAGYQPSVIHACDRQSYYEALKQGPEALRLLIIDSMESGLEAGLRHLKERFKARRMPPRRERWSLGM
jgi:Fic family protein